MRPKVRVTITNDKLPALRREMRQLGRPAPASATLMSNLAAQARAIADAEGLDYNAVFENLCRIERIKQRLGPKANDMAIARELAAELGVSVEELLEAGGLELDGEAPA